MPVGKRRFCIALGLFAAWVAPSTASAQEVSSLEHDTVQGRENSIVLLR